MHAARIVLCAGLLAAGAAALAQSGPPGRGQLLYETHCTQCHTAQVHWRDHHVARDWPSLRAWVDRWQSQIGQAWPAEDVDEVTRYLNERIYHFAAPRPQG